MKSSLCLALDSMLLLTAGASAAEPRMSHSKLPGTWSEPAATTTAPTASVRRTVSSKSEIVQGDWRVQCRDRASPPCEMTQTVKRPDAPATTMRMALSYLAGADRYRVTLRLPPDVRSTTGAIVRLDKGTNATVYYFSHCDAQGCYAERQMSPGELAKLQAATSAAVTAVGDTHSSVLFPVSLDGFSPALAIVVKRNGQQATISGGAASRR
jgi:invasion protein IalB